MPTLRQALPIIATLGRRLGGRRAQLLAPVTLLSVIGLWYPNSIITALCVLSTLAVLASARPDSAGNPPLPGPGLSYGGIPYGSMSGNVAAYFNQQAPSSGRARNLAPHPVGEVDFAPIEQWLR